MKEFSGKALYQPKGKAAEYSPWAVNFYTGCSNDCEYCYCKRGVMSHVWDNKPRLKKCFTTTQNALDVFNMELGKNINKIGDSGILFSFTTDPLLPETRDLTFRAMEDAISLGIPVKILTKRADWLYDFFQRMEIQTILYGRSKHLIAFGFSLTGADELEPGAAPNHLRIEAMEILHTKGFKTFASIEPVINPQKAVEIILKTYNFCNLYKIGLISGKSKDFYKSGEVKHLWWWLEELVSMGHKIYPKDSLLAYMGKNRSDLINFVNADYNLFQTITGYEHKFKNKF